MTATALTAAPQNRQIGAGYLFRAPLGSTKPTDLTTAWDAAWIPVGLTDDGNTFTSTPAVSAVSAAELIPPIAYYTTGSDETVEFSMMELTATNLATAFNGGTKTTSTGQVIYTPPAIGSEVRCMLGWESEDHTERWVYFQAFSSGARKINRQKAPNSSLIPVTLSLELPAGQTSTWEAIMLTSVTSGATSRG